MSTLLRKNLTITFLLINFGWTWFFWLLALAFQDQSLVVRLLVIIGGFGPALAALAMLRISSRAAINTSAKRIAVFLLASAVLLAVMITRYLVGNAFAFDQLADNLSLQPLHYGLALLASLTGGWVISSAAAQLPAIRERMATIFPQKGRWGWIIFGLVFYPLMILVAWGLALLVGLPIEYPQFGEMGWLQTVLFFLLTFVLTALAQGGMEEPGWRGWLQPQLERGMSPLIAALLVALFWSLWHLPLWWNGFYGGDVVGGMLGGGIFRILLAIFLAWVYRRSGGNLLTVILLHTSFNVAVNYMPTSDVGLLVLWLLVAIAVVIKDKMYLKANRAS